MKPKYLYHGSKVKVDRLEPNQAFGFGGDADCIMGIYAVEERNLAIPFTFKIINATAKSLFRVDTELTPPEVVLKNCSLDWNSIGYLYKLPSESFEKVDNLQWVSLETVTPIEIIEIKPKEYKKWVVYEKT